MPRILYIARAPFISGAERALVTMLRTLDRRTFQPGVVLGHDTVLARDLRELDIPVWVVPLPKREPRHAWGWWRSVRRLHQIVRDFQPALLHANDVPSCQAVSVVGRKLHLPRAVHVRWGISSVDLSWWARDGMEAVICISQWVRRELGDVRDPRLAAARIDVLTDAVAWADADAPRPTDAPDREATVRLGFAGQLIASKGVDLLIEALALLPAEQRPLLHVAGKDTQQGGAYQKHLQDLAASRGVADRIRWLGFLPQVADLYRQIDAVVCPSRVEPLGLVPLEAAEFYLPALANNLGGLAETIRDGETGWLVEPTPQAWAQALQRLSDRALLCRAGQAAHQHTRAHYRPAIYWQRLGELYRSLLGDT